MRRLKCSDKDPNHSKDVFEVWYGRPEPIDLCGFHFQKWSAERKKKLVPQSEDKQTLDTVNR